MKITVMALLRRYSICLLLFKEIEKSLASTVFSLGRGPAPLLLYENLCFIQRAKIVGALIRHPNLDRFHALVARRGIKIQAIATGMQVRAALTAFFGDLDLILEVVDEAYEILRDQTRRERYRRAITAAPR